MIDEKKFNPLVKTERPEDQKQFDKDKKIERSDDKEKLEEERTEDNQNEKLKMPSNLELTQIKENTIKEINKARDELGLPATAELPPSIKSLNKQISQTEPKKPGLEKGKRNVEVERRVLLEFADTANGLLNAMQRRERDRLAPLIEAGNLANFKIAISDIKDLLSRPDYKLSKLATEMNKIGQLIGLIGKAPRKPPLKDDTQNLGMVMFGLKKLDDESQNLFKLFSMSDPEQSSDIIKASRAISGQCKNVWPYLARLKDALGRYGR